MTTLAYADANQPDAAARAAAAADLASRRWRTVWRTHFYAGVFATPFLVLMALTGLVILYTQPIQSLTQGDLRNVKDTGEWVSFEQQEAAVAAKYPDVAITSLVLPRNATTSSSFGLEDGREVFVNPYDATVLGADKQGGGIVGLANRLHGFFNNDKVTIPLPSVSALLGEGAFIQDYVLGDVLLEILGVWTLVLVASGIYLWMPRRTRTNTSRRKALIIPRRGTKGRAKWRDLHATGGIVLCGFLAFFLISGLPWSGYWGSNFNVVADKLTPNRFVETPNSSVAKLGDLDRLGNKINWNTSDAAIPNSASGGVDPTSLPARISLDTIVTAAGEEGMKPGYSISFPENGKDEAGAPTYGSYVLGNSWPRKTGEARTVFVDQFSGKTIDVVDVYGMGAVSRATDTLVSTHMGTQLGVVNRIVVTLVCMLTLWSVISAVIMYSRRRRPGTLGLPKRPRSVKLANRLIVIAVVIGIAYPLWGVTALAILAFDRFVIRKVPKLRATFGQA